MTENANTQRLNTMITSSSDETSDNTYLGFIKMRDDPVLQFNKLRLSYEKEFFENVVPAEYKCACLDFMDLQPISFIEFGKNWAKNPHSFYLYGACGNGKTHFCFSLIREMFKKSGRLFWPRYFTSTNLDTLLLRAVMEEGGDSYFIENISKAEILFIDDFGRENKSDRTRRQYFEILNFRYSHQLPTILTGNFDLSHIAKEFGEAIVSRIQSWKVIRHDGSDIRKAKNPVLNSSKIDYLLKNVVDHG